MSEINNMCEGFRLQIFFSLINHVLKSKFGSTFPSQLGGGGPLFLVAVELYGSTFTSHFEVTWFHFY